MSYFSRHLIGDDEKRNKPTPEECGVCPFCHWDDVITNNEGFTTCLVCGETSYNRDNDREAK